MSNTEMNAWRGLPDFKECATVREPVSHGLELLPVGFPEDPKNRGHSSALRGPASLVGSRPVDSNSFGLLIRKAAKPPSCWSTDTAGTSPSARCVGTHERPHCICPAQRDGSSNGC